MTLYFQCDMSQGDKRTRAYIEQRAAKLGSMVEIKEEGFDGLWRVDSVPESGVDERWLSEQQILNRNSFGSITGQKGAK